MAMLAAFLLAGCTSTPTETETVLVIDPLMAPIPQAPPDGSAYRYQVVGGPPTIELVWRHGMPTAQVPSPHQADRFIVCVYDEQTGRCESGVREGVPPPIWLEAAADDPIINRTPIEQEQPPFLSPLVIHLGYAFRTDVRMRTELAGRRLLWQVGACLAGTCRMSDPRSLRVVREDEQIGIGYSLGGIEWLSNPP